MRVLSSSSSNDGEDSDDNDDSDGSDGGGGDDDNNEGNNSVDGETYSLEGHMQELSLTSCQDYGVKLFMNTYHNLRDLQVLVSVYLLTTEMIVMILCLIAI